MTENRRYDRLRVELSQLKEGTKEELDLLKIYISSAYCVLPSQAKDFLNCSMSLG